MLLCQWLGLMLWSGGPVGQRTRDRLACRVRQVRERPPRRDAAMLMLLRIALRNVVRNRRRSLITLSAVFLAIGIMVATRGLLNGLQGAIREGVVKSQTGAIQIHKKGFLGSLQATPLDLDIP